MKKKIVRIGLLFAILLSTFGTSHAATNDFSANVSDTLRKNIPLSKWYNKHMTGSRTKSVRLNVSLVGQVLCFKVANTTGQILVKIKDEHEEILEEGRFWVNGNACFTLSPSFEPGENYTLNVTIGEDIYVGLLEF